MGWLGADRDVSKGPGGREGDGMEGESARRDWNWLGIWGMGWEPSAEEIPKVYEGDPNKDS